jgi:hypothetical protein
MVVKRQERLGRLSLVPRVAVLDARAHEVQEKNNTPTVRFATLAVFVRIRSGPAYTSVRVSVDWQHRVAGKSPYKQLVLDAKMCAQVCSC